MGHPPPHFFSKNFFFFTVYIGTFITISVHIMIHFVSFACLICKLKACFKVNKPSLKLKNNSALLANLELSQFQKIFDPSEPTIVAPRVNSKSAELVYNVAPPLLNYFRDVGPGIRYIL